MPARFWAPTELYFGVWLQSIYRAQSLAGHFTSAPITSPLTGQMGAQKVVAIIMPDTNVTRCFPASWPSTCSDNWLLQMAELRAAEVSCPQGQSLESFMAQSIGDFERYVEKISIPGCFEHFDWKPELEYRLDAAKWPRS